MHLDQRAGLCFYKAITECVRYLLRRFGLSNAHTKQLSLAIRQVFLSFTEQDLLQVERLHDPSDLLLIALAGKQTAHALLKASEAGHASTAALVALRQRVSRIETLAHGKSFVIASSISLPPRLQLTCERLIKWQAFPGLEVSLMAEKQKLDQLSAITGIRSCTGMSAR